MLTFAASVWPQPSSLPATSVLPWTPRIPASSNCVTYQSTAIYSVCLCPLAASLTPAGCADHLCCCVCCDCDRGGCQRRLCATLLVGRLGCCVLGRRLGLCVGCQAHHDRCERRGRVEGGQRWLARAPSGDARLSELDVRYRYTGAIDTAVDMQRCSPDPCR